jgi:CHAT domain-containing protein
MDLTETDIVVLSACDTGLGDVSGDGVFGLQRAFKQAGVQTIVMSLWRVDDAATELMMTTFYNNLLSGKSKRDSFIIAQNTLRNHEQFSNPYYWAAFVMLD